MKKIILSLLLLGAFGFAQSASAADRHAGYYYPEPQSFEVYTSSFDALPNNSKLGRVGFTVGLNTQQQKRAYAPTHHLFAKGANAQKLIIVSTGSGGYNTLYRLRALLAALTSDARISTLFRKLPNPENTNFLDLIKMAGFELVTLSDGVTISHQIELR